MIESAKYRLRNMQKGFSFIRYQDFRVKVNEKKQQYNKELPIDIETNVKIRSDITLHSVCTDQVIEDYLHSKVYTLKKIGVLLNPFRYAPKTAVLLFYSPNPVYVNIKVVSGDTKVEYYDSSSLKQYHRISIAGLGNGENKIFLSVFDENGQEKKTIRGKINLTNVKELETFPIVKTEITKESMYPQIIVTGGTIDPFVFNTDGSIFHFFDFRDMHTSQYGIYMIDNGKFLWPVRNVGVPTYTNPYSCQIYEMDFMGRVSRTYYVNKGIHHAACELPNGNLVSISSSLDEHTADVLVEIERKTGNIVRWIDLKDIFGELYRNQIDWIHPNSLEYNPEDESMTFCMRNIHTVAKINWKTLEIIWMLALPELWENTEYEGYVLKPEGEVHYAFQAHAAYEVKELQNKEKQERVYLVFNNNRLNRRPIEGYEDDGYSYISIYVVNEKTKAVRQIKDLQIDKSIVRSNARYDVESNRIYNMSGCLSRDNVEVRGKIEEYDFETEELINRWYVSKDFYSAYHFVWSSDDMAKPLVLDSNYQFVCGQTDRMIQVDVKWPEMPEIIKKPYFSKPYIEETNFFFKTKDHSISALLFVGQHHSYQRDYSDTWQSLELHSDKNYHCVVSLLGMEEDRYQIKVLIDGKVYNTGKFVHIRNKKDR